MSAFHRLLATAVLTALILAPATPAGADPAPGAPGDLHVTAITSVSVTLSWTASTGAVDSYAINYAQAFDDVYRSQPVGDVTTATITTAILPARQYTFSVTARDADGHTASGTNSVTVVTPASDTAADRTPPATPPSLRLTGVTAAGAALTWQPATDDVAVTGYNVYHFDGWYTSVLAGTPTGTSFTAPLLSSSTGLHIYYVRARDAAGNVSIASNTVTATPPPACAVTYKTSSQWPGGFVAEVTVTNNTTAAVPGWTLTLHMAGDQHISQSWNATFTQSGADVTLKAAPWNQTIPPNASVTAGLSGTWSASTAPPTAATLNAAPCTI
jgi:hypothetical protein